MPLCPPFNRVSFSHCATHQIRLILVSSVVITSLLFPAIASYYSSQTQYFAGFSLRVLDAFLTPDDISSYFAQHDLRHLWEGDAALRVREDAVARARCGMEGTLREERVLVGSVSPEDGVGALDKSTLHAAFRLERRITAALATRGIPCLQTRGGACFALSPSAFWGRDELALASDDNVLDTINYAENITLAGVPVTPDMVLAGREYRDSASHYVDWSTFLVLTYFFPEKDCFANDGHFQWLHTLEDAGADAGELVVLAQQPHLIAFEVSQLYPFRSLIHMRNARRAGPVFVRTRSDNHWRGPRLCSRPLATKVAQEAWIVLTRPGLRSSYSASEQLGAHPRIQTRRNRYVCSP